MSRPAMYQLMRLNLARMLHSASADRDDIDSSIGVALSLLALPGGFLSLLFLNKYGSLLHFLRGQIHFDPYAASLPDEYLFIVLAMTVSAAVALWKWDALFLDRRDFLNIAPLPVRRRLIFTANLSAIFLFALLFCLDVNAASGVLYPIVVSASQESFVFFFRIAGGHIAAILAASLFSFLSVFAVAGVFMALLPARAFQVIAIYLRGLLAMALLVLCGSALRVSRLLEQHPSSPALRYLPSAWFLGICQWARGIASAGQRQFAGHAGIAIAAVFVIGAFSYGVAYTRHFTRTAELTSYSSTGHLRPLFSLLARPLDATLFRTPYERASLRFVVRTLLRSDRHTVTVAAFCMVGIIAAAQLLIANPSAAVTPTTVQLAAPLLLLYFAISGIRIAFDLPCELNANWIFRILLAPTLDECSRTAAKILGVLAMPFIACTSAMFLRWSIAAAVCEFFVLAAFAVPLSAALTVSFRKLPFTCPKAGFRHSAIVEVMLYALSGTAFAALPSAIQHWAGTSPLRLTVFIPLLAAAWWGILELRKSQLPGDRQISFEQSGIRDFEVLNLSS